ncbi:large subunit ribosomal protein L49, partial [Phenoliferia sp. Uapishka_3]
MLLQRLSTSLRPLAPSISFRTLSAAPTPSPSTPTPSTSTLPPPEEQPTLLPYSLKRTPSGFLPVYVDVKSGGQRLSTIVRKIDGDVEALRRDLAEAMPSVQAYTKPAARQVILRGDWSKETKEWLGDRGF